MKSIYSLIAAIALSLALATAAGAQQQNDSLGDYARAARKKTAQQGKAAAKVYDNDNLPADASLSVVGNAPADNDADKAAAAPSDSKADPAKTADKSEKKDAAQIKPGQSAEERQKALDAWKKKLDAQRDKISLLTRELDVLQREYQLKISEFYSDTARRVQNPNALFDDDAKYKQQIEDKQKSLDDAKTELSNLQDEAHRSGAPSSTLE
jgi:hypothetical protein